MTEHITIQAALAAVMADVREVRKSDKNTAQHFNFRGIDAVVNAVGPALRKHGVVVLPEVLDYEYGSVSIGRNNTQMGHVRLRVKYTFVGPSGDSLAATVPGEAMDSGDKATAKAMSVAFRTALLQALALPTDDPDPDSYSYERSDGPTVVDDSEVDEFAQMMRSALSIVDLDQLGRKAAQLRLSEDQRERLRKEYLDAKDALAQTAAS